MMIKEMTYREKFQILNRWMPKILDAVKKDLRQEHLQRDVAFAKKHFSGKNINKLTHEELAPAYSQRLAEEGEGTEELGEFIANRWLLKNTEAYEFFERRLSEIDPNFQEIRELEKEKALVLMEEAVGELGALRTYIFSVLNSVVFPQEVFKKLEERSIQSQEYESKQAHEKAERTSLEQTKKDHEREIARLTDKYEKKLIGMQKKYAQDVELLKKQAAQLQRKLQSQEKQ